MANVSVYNIEGKEVGSIELNDAVFGVVIILGALIGSVLEKTGAALKLADMVIKVVGKKRPELAIELMGWVVSIPVFCDSGFVILNPIRKALVKRTAASSVAMTVALSAGLYISHVFIPPTPGPIAAANTLGVGDNLLLVMGLGVLPSLYAWFNILSNWDPYGSDSTSNIKVAVAYDDTGINISGIDVNISTNIIEALKTNDTIGWVFTDTTDEAIEGVWAGDYYAALIMPEDFSKDMVSFLADNML